MLSRGYVLACLLYTRIHRADHPLNSVIHDSLPEIIFSIWRMFGRSDTMVQKESEIGRGKNSHSRAAQEFAFRAACANLKLDFDDPFPSRRACRPKVFVANPCCDGRWESRIL